MGNCQAAEAVAIVIQHPSGGRVERAHGAVSAAAVMAANPGHYVAAVVPAAPPSMASAPAAPAKRRLKLLRPDDTLVLGGVYRLVSFEEVLTEFVSKRHAMLSRVVIADEEDVATATDGKAALYRRRDRSQFFDASSAPESDSALAKGELQRSRGEESTIVRRSVGIGRRAILRRRHMMECLNSKQASSLGLASRRGSEHGLKGPTSHTSDPSSDEDSPSEPEPEPEPGFDAAAMAHGMVLGGRFGLSRHGQWRPALPSIAEGSVVC